MCAPMFYEWTGLHKIQREDAPRVYHKEEDKRMKGDLFLLGGMGISILAIPMLVLMWSGMPMDAQAVLQNPATAVSTPMSDSGQSKSGLDSLITEVPLSGSQTQNPESEASVPNPEEDAPDYKCPIKDFKILNRSTGKIEKISIRDYVRGAVASEMPAAFHTEALKAQGVSALSYALHAAAVQRANPDPALGGADFSADPQNRLGYMTQKQVKEFYGDNADYSWQKICEAADEAAKWVMLYEGEPIAAAYHAISAGITESAANIWGGELPYLVEADSSWDMLAESFRSVVTISKEELQQKITAAGIQLEEDPEAWLEILERSPAGYVTKIRVGNAELHGNQLRDLLGLRSACFYYSIQTRGFVFDVRGYGHGAGLSQNGADYLARQGKSFTQILHHYYTGIQMAKMA